jgi:hypothetical protein
MAQRTLAYRILSVSGFSFLFLLGFPFGNHNESYAWVAQFRSLGIFDVLVTPLSGVAGFRPFGVALARATYAISGGEVWLQQLCNWLFALSAWAVVFAAARERYLFGLIALAVGGVFFSGYIFLFHLHGVFYGPLLVYVAVLIILGRREPVGLRGAVLLFLLTLLVSLFHPFALLIYAFFVAAETWVRRKGEDIGRARLNVLLLFAAVVAGRIVVSDVSPHSTTEAMSGFLTSFRMVEVNLMASGLAYVLSLTVLVTIDMPRNTRVLWMITLTVLAAVFPYVGIPVLLVWIGVVLVKCAMTREWRLAAIVLSCLLLPLATATGSPTYSVFVLMASAFVTAYAYDRVEGFLQARVRLPYAVVSILAVLLIALKSGAHVPVISRVVNPILAEQEKTFQLEEIIEWNKTSVMPRRRLSFVDGAENPVASTNAIDRRHRPPTSQRYLDAFLGEAVHAGSVDSSSLVVTFGDRQLDGREIVFRAPGLRNGAAVVWR